MRMEVEWVLDVCQEEIIERAALGQSGSLHVGSREGEGVFVWLGC